MNYTSSSERREIVVLAKITASKNEVALSYYRVRGLNLLSVVFAAIVAAVSHYRV